jgi:hypothetical protein
VKAPELQEEEGTAGRDAAIVVLPGYLSEEQGPGAGWTGALRACGWDGAIYSLRWDASTYRGLVEAVVLRGGLVGARLHWWWIKRRARRTAALHAGPLLREGLPFGRVSLVGHSLGARLTYFALMESRPRPVIDDLLFAGGALRRDSSTAWRRACDAIGGRVLNLRNAEDFVLRRVYRAAERLRTPCGLKPVKHPGANLVEIDATAAMRAAGQTGLLESHSGYPAALPALLRFVEGRAEPL